jgi:hypothetical protein
MKFLTQDDAEAIAKKLQVVPEPGTRHDNVYFYYKNKLIFSFGIRRSSREVPHNYIPIQMKISQKECRSFRRCDISLEAYIETLKLKQFITD